MQDQLNPSSANDPQGNAVLKEMLDAQIKAAFGGFTQTLEQNLSAMRDELTRSTESVASKLNELDSAAERANAAAAAAAATTDKMGSVESTIEDLKTKLKETAAATGAAVEPAKNFVAKHGVLIAQGAMMVATVGAVFYGRRQPTAVGSVGNTNGN